MRLIALAMAFYLGLGSLLPRADFSQFLRLRALVEHYNCHLTEYDLAAGVASFRQFLNDHYTSPDKHRHPDGSHHQLPLQQLSAGAVFSLPVAELFLPVRPVATEEMASPFTEILFQPVSFTGAVFHPPLA